MKTSRIAPIVAGAFLAAGAAFFAADTDAILAADKAASPAAEKAAVGGKPSELYMKKCAKCHGDDGKAQTEKGKKMKAQDFTDPDFQQHVGDDKLIDAITNGTEKNMPAFGKTLSAEEIAGLAKEVRSFSH